MHLLLPTSPATILTPPTRPLARPGFGAWNLRDVKFLTGSQLASWGIACFANPRFAEPDLCQMQAERGPSFIKVGGAGRTGAGGSASRAGVLHTQAVVQEHAARSHAVAGRDTCLSNPNSLPTRKPLPCSHLHQEFIDMLNSCGVQTPTNPLPPCIMAPRGAAPAEIMRRAAEGEGRVERCWVKRQAG